MHTHQRRAVNFFVPDANFMFHVLSLCDGMIGTTHRFLQSAPAWLPIVSQLYVSVLWLYAKMRIYVHTGYGLEFSDLVRNMTEILRLDECMIPGPLVPFFESLAATNGPFDWIGDITVALPNFEASWSTTDWHIQNDWIRSIPLPALLLDQLAYFGTWTPPDGQTIYNNFEWFRNIFSVPSAAHATRFNRLGPHSTGSLFSTQSQTESARAFWNRAFQGFTRLNAADGQPALNSWVQLLGFTGQTNTIQIDWFQQIAIVMQKYAHFFNGSKQLKTISPVGLGAVLVTAKPQGNTETRNWLYPATFPGPFLSSRFAPLREIPNAVRLDFAHSDHDVEEIAEQYAILCSTNVQWSANNAPQGTWRRINRQNTHEGDYWTMMTHRQALAINLKAQYAQLIAGRYHQSVATRSE
jgi:hypothetical protein